MGKLLRVLLIEDNEDDAQLVLRELRRAGHEPASERAQSAAEVKAALERGPWDIVISDFSMPQFDGVAALRLLRERDPDTPFIFVSGTIGEAMAVDAMRAGAQDYVIKGNLGRLAPAIERELRETQSRRARRMAEEALRTAERRLHRVNEATPAVTYLLSVDSTPFTILWVSDNVERVMGYLVEEVLAPNWGLDHIHPDDVEHYRAAIPALFAQGAAAREFRLRRKDGAYRWVLDEQRLLRDEHGTPSEVVGAMLDITDRKKLESQLMQAHKMEAIGRLAGGVAHDFNNLLGAIFMELDCALGDLPADHTVREGLQQVKRAAEQAASMTRHLLEFSRRQITAPSVFELNDVVSTAERMLRRLVGEDITVTVRLSPSQGTVRADRGQLEQVLVNLVVNARDAMPQGGELIIETAHEELDAAGVRLHQGLAPGSYMVLSVADTGIGMAPEVRSRIFEPFFTTKERGKGTGLGLATSYGIVKQSGGYIEVQSEAGHGTRFRVYLPRGGDAPTSMPAAPEVVDTRGSETILLVEDSDLLRGAASRYLRQQGYHVLEAVDGLAASRLLTESREPIDLLLTDVVLPGMQGPELAARALEARPGMRLLFSSGYGEDSATLRRLMDEGASLLAKPYAQETLTRRVREVLNAPPPGAG